MSISFFDDLGGPFSTFQSTFAAWITWTIIRRLTLSKNEHFIFLAGEGWQIGFESINQPGQSSEVEHNPKTSILLFWLERGGRSIDQPGQSSEVERNPKMSISFFGWREVADGV